MARRELRGVQSEKVLGAVEQAAGRTVFEGNAAEVLSPLIRRLGDDRTAEIVLREGWSNGYLYFAEVDTDN